MEIKILGPGCMNCKTLERRVNEALTQMNINVPVIKVSNIHDIIKAGVLKTPA